MIGSTKEVLAALDPLLDQVLDLEPDEREIWFAALRLERPGLARELESLLGQESRLEARGFLGGDGSPGLFDGLPSLAGLPIGAYTLEEPIGQGGMGSVWLARRSDGRFEGTAAVKLLNLALVDPIGVERFRREGTVLAQVAHPNIARLLDAGVTEAGQPFLVLEHVEGQRIDLYCDEHRLGPPPRLALFRQVLAAVAHAHASLIVHRDLKPSNILVTQDGTVKLLDFGIAKLLEGDIPGAERTELTDRGGLPLTPEYAAPEQVLGARITTATDVYSLGVLLYVLLAGRHPTSGGSLTTAGHLSGILDAEPPRLSTAVTGSGTTHRDDVTRAAAARGTTVERLKRLYHGDLDNIVAKALKKDPAQRYPTVTALADDLERHLRHQPVQARPDSFGYRARKFVRRNRVGVAAGSIIVATLAAAAVVTTSQMVEAQRQRHEAEQRRDEAQIQRDRARYEERRATASAGFMESLLQSIAPSGKAYTTGELLERARQLLETDFRADPRFMARMMVDLSGHYSVLGTPAHGVLLNRAVELATESNDPETAAHARCLVGRNQSINQQFEEARSSLERAARDLARVREPATEARMRCLEARAKLASQEGPRDSTLPLVRRALALGEAAGDTASVGYASALSTLSVELHTLNRLREALETNRLEIGILDRIGRSSTLQMVLARFSEARYLRDLGEMRAADSALTGVLKVARRIDSLNLPTYMTILVGELSAGLARRDSAVRVFTRAAASANRDDDSFLRRWALTGLAIELIERGLLDEARRRIAEIAEMEPDRRGGRLRMLEAQMAEAEGDAPRAHRMFMEALVERGFPDGPMVPPWHRVVARAARAALAAGDAVAADSLALHALRLERGMGHDESRSVDVGTSLLLLARARLAQGDSAGARETLQRARRPLENGVGAGHPRTVEARALLDTLSRR